MENNKIIIVYDGKTYIGKPLLLSVHDGMANIAVKGNLPISMEVEEIDAKTTTSEDKID